MGERPATSGRSGAPADFALTITGHAGLFIEANGASILVDPWLGGSCYWRSWWQFPPPPEAPDAWLAPDYLMISHHHFDHIHYPSLRRIDRGTEVLIPRFAIDEMAGELSSLGFTNVRELDHGDVVELTGGLTVASYQYGFDDSLIAIAAADTVVLDVNDCKIRGRALDRVLADFGRPTFLLKNYSAAQAYPHCYRAEDPADLTLLSQDSYLADFLATVERARPSFAVPFASMVCFLHPETWPFNDEVVTPDRVAEAFAGTPVDGCELVVLSPGDGYRGGEGFIRSGVDYYAEREARLETLRDEAAGRVGASLAVEAQRPLGFEAFAAYFTTMLEALPRLVTRLLRRPVVFEANGEHWVIDGPRRRVTRQSSLPPGWATCVTVAPGVLADAIDKHIVNFVHISMRLRIEVAPGGIGTDLMFWALLIIYELGYFPLRSLSVRRVAPIAWRRRREFLDMALVAAQGEGSLAQRLSASFMASPD